MACTEELKEIEPDIEGRRVFELRQSLVANDTCWNQSQLVQLNAGDILFTCDKDSGHRGNVIFTVNGEKTVILPNQALKTRYPGDLGLFDPTILMEVTEADNLCADDPRLQPVGQGGGRGGYTVRCKPAGMSGPG